MKVAKATSDWSVMASLLVLDYLRVLVLLEGQGMAGGILVQTSHPLRVCERPEVESE
jgi:hypothetical protein